MEVMSSIYNLQHLQKLVSQGEGATLEFKRKANFPEKIVKEMVAFANSNGGYLLVGVSDNGTVPGLKFVEEEKYVLDRAITLCSKPTLKYSCHTVSVNNDRAVLIYQIFPSEKKPHYALEKSTHKWGKAYVRVNDKSVQASREMVEILRRQNKSEKGQKIFYGEKENRLFKYLETKNKITISEYCSIADLPRKVASKTLVKLVLSQVLNLVRDDRGEYYEFNQSISD